MNCINNRLDGSVKRMSSDLAEAFIERARLHYRLVTMRLTGPEMEALRVVSAAKMREDDADDTDYEERTKSRIALSHEMSREFFDNYCQEYVTKVVKIDVVLQLDSEGLAQRFDSRINKMPPNRRDRALELIILLMTNAVKWAEATLSISRAGLDRDQSEKAYQYGIFVIESAEDLNPFERRKAKEWLTRWWVRGGD